MVNSKVHSLERTRDVAVCVLLQCCKLAMVAEALLGGWRSQATAIITNYYNYMQHACLITVLLNVQVTIWHSTSEIRPAVISSSKHNTSLL